MQPCYFLKFLQRAGDFNGTPHPTLCVQVIIYIYFFFKEKKIKNCHNHIIASAVSDSVLCLDEDTGFGVTLRASVSIYK